MHLDIICYDDGCHLRKYTRNPERSKVTSAAARLSEINIVVDKMHFKGHVDDWCKKIATRTHCLS